MLRIAYKFTESGDFCSKEEICSVLETLTTMCKTPDLKEEFYSIAIKNLDVLRKPTINMLIKRLLARHHFYPTVAQIITEQDEILNDLVKNHYPVLARSVLHFEKQ